MKQINKEVPTTKTISVWVAADGKEFNNAQDCRNYEYTLFPKENKVILTARKGLTDFEGEHFATLYHIESLDDWKILTERVWYHYQTVQKFPGPGFYLAIYYDGGDYYHPTYDIIEVKEYLHSLSIDLNEYIETLTRACDECTGKRK